MKTFIRRVLFRGKRIYRDVADIGLRKSYASRPRAPRPAMPITDLPFQPALLVIAHPDDEAIAGGALLARLPRAGVICVTDGAPRQQSHARQAGFDNWLDYAQARRREAEAALSLLEREIAPSRSLGIADQDAVYDLVSITRHLVKPLQSGFHYVITHAYEGGHPDHDAAAFCVHAACALIAKSGAAPPAIVEAPLYSAPDGKYVHSVFVPQPDAGPVVSFKLSAHEQDLKRRMFACHATQQRWLGDFGVTEEKFRIAPRYHFSAPPHAGEVGYNQFGWPMNGRIWRRLAWRAMRELGVLEELA